ncbi:MAG TPA: DUF981 family protein [Thermoplasmata archaeon]|nr:DUF981 family protein [Thermoplasmata archaeon]
MAFIDFLAFQEVLLLLAAVMVCYVGVTVAFAMRRNDPAGVKSALRSGAIPLGSVGAIATVLAVWAEINWPFPAIPNTNMASYNVFFTDVYLLFGLTLVVLAVTMAASQKLQFAGLFGLVAGGVTISYGYAGYGFGMTKDPLETFLLYGAFGLSGVLAFPATLIVDHFQTHPESSLFVSKAPLARRRPSFLGASRAVQPVVPAGTSGAEDPTPGVIGRFHVPIYFNAALIAFIVMMALAGIAALLYLNTTLPGHLASAP